MANVLTIRKRCLRCLSVLDSAGNCTNKNCVRYPRPVANDGTEGTTEATESKEKK